MDKSHRGSACNLSRGVLDSRKEVGCPLAPAAWWEIYRGLHLAPGAAPPSRRMSLPRPAPKRAGKSRQRLNALNAKDRIAGPATLALLVSLWLPWYSLGPFSADGLSVHGWLFIAVLNSVVLVLYVLITAFGVGDLAEPGPSIEGSAPCPHDRGQCCPRRAGLPDQAGRIRLVVGRLRRAGRRHRGVSAVWRASHPGSAPALNPSPPGDVGVRASQEGVGWSVIGFGGADVDALL